MLHKKFSTLMEEASRAMDARAHTPVGMSEPTAFIATPPARSLMTCLNTEDLPALFDKEGRVRRTPNGSSAGATIRLAAGLVGGSRVANAGAHVLIYPEAITPHVDPRGTVAVESVPSGFRNIEAAGFGTVDVDTEADAPVIALPVFSAPIDWRQSIAKGVRIEIPRSERRRTDPEQLAAEIITSLTLGLGRAADDVLLSALSALGLSPFSLSLVAAQGLAFAELRALIGTAGAGASIGQDGMLRASGIAAELTGDMAKTIAGAWNRAGVAVNQDVSVHVERLDVNGRLAVTAWASMLPLVPDADKFWTIA